MPTMRSSGTCCHGFINAPHEASSEEGVSLKDITGIKRRQISGCLTEFDGLSCTVTSGTGKDLCLLRLVDHDFDDPDVLLVGQCCGLPGGSNRNDSGDTVLFLEIDEPSETGLVDGTIILERGDDCGCSSLEHINSLQSVP